MNSLGPPLRSRGGGSKEVASSSRHPEFSRSMSSDNWREAKKREGEVDLGGSWRNRPDHNRPGIAVMGKNFSAAVYSLMESRVYVLSSQ